MPNIYSHSAQLQLKSPAKINRCLRILNRREDGYHNLQSLFQLIDWADEMNFIGTSSPEIQLSGMPNSVTLEQNLIYKAARLLQTHATIHQGAQIQINKELPMGAGLGGGSSNAATTLIALNQLWKLNLPQSELMNMGKQLGADVPFFISGKNAWIEGIGDQITPVNITQKEIILIISPPIEVSTAKIFQHPELSRTHTPIDTPKADTTLHPLEHSENHCEQLVRHLYPQLNALFIQLEAFIQNITQKTRPNSISTHIRPQLTGTGSTIFIAFPPDQTLDQFKTQLASYLQSILQPTIKSNPTLNPTLNQCRFKWIISN